MAAYSPFFRMLRRPATPHFEPGSRRGRFSFALGVNVRDIFMDATGIGEETLPSNPTHEIFLSPEEAGAGAGAPTGVSRADILHAAKQAGRKRGGRGGQRRERRKAVVTERRVTRSMTQAARAGAVSGRRRVVVLIDDAPVDRSRYEDMTWMPAA
ncbi:hypothetical protein MBLNU459_g6920t1 [Dothideomycetes sp. NU459]